MKKRNRVLSLMSQYSEITGSLYYETRMAILRKKEELDGLNIDSAVLEFIAANIKSNIRELEGALTRLVAFSRLNNGREIDVAMAESELKDFRCPLCAIPHICCQTFVEFRFMTHHQDTALIVQKRTFQFIFCIHIQVVGRFV